MARRSIPAALRIATAVVVAMLAVAPVALPAVAQSTAPASPAPATVAPASPAIAATPVPASPVPASPAAGASSAPGAAASPAASTAPCPNPTPPPTPTPGPTLAPGQTATPAPKPSATPHPNLCPAQPNGADPFSLVAWIFTPVFQVLFMGLAFFYNVFHDIGIAIIVLTIVIRLILVPVFRAQIVSQRRMQMLQPEIKAIQAKYKGDRAKISEEQMKLYKDRGVNPASGCLPALLQMVLLVPMYQVFSQGLNAPDISSMLQVFGHPVPFVQVICQDPGNPMVPCIDPHVWWLAWLPQITADGISFYPGGMPANLPEIFVNILPGAFGLSLLALVAAVLQIVQTRMMATPTDDPQAKSQQRLFLILPLFSLIYGWFLPAGLFIYWIVTTLFSIVQQYLINGWGALFPLFGWHPAFAKNHQPRFPVKQITPRPTSGGPGSATVGDNAPASARRTAADSAAGTIKPVRGRTSRRGRRR